MVKEKTIKDIIYHQCEACDMYYKTKELAEKCEKHCKEKNACDMKIIKHAVELRK